MLGFSQEIQSGARKINAVWLDITLSDSTLLELNEGRVLLNGLTRDTSTSVDGEFTVGAAVTGKLSAQLDNSDEFLSPYDFRGAVIVAYLGWKDPAGIETTEKVNIGRYHVSEYTYDGNNVNLVAYDDMCMFDVPCKDSGYTFNSNTSIVTLMNYAISVANANGASLASNAVYNIPYQPSWRWGTQLPQWDTMTWHDVVAAVAQSIGHFARIEYTPNPATYKLVFRWYNTSQMTADQYDGGTFDTTTTPYSDGATLDGGSFDPWNTGDEADGGAFGDRDDINIIPSPYSLVVDTDDVLITGVSSILEPTNNIDATEDTKTYTYTKGDPGYVIQITDNPLIYSTSKAQNITNYIYNTIAGMRFRPLSASIVENPAIEAGDVAYITGNNGNTYSCFLSHVTYTVNAATNVSCDAASTMQNLKGRYSGAQKTTAMVQRVMEKTMTDAQFAMSGIMGALSTTMGLNDYSYTDQSGAKIYLFGNGPSLATSEIQWRFAAGAMSVSSDYGVTWNAALSAAGIAVLQEVYAVKVNADYIETGTLTVGGTGKGIGTIYIKDNSNTILGTVDNAGIHYGKTSVSDNTHTGFFLSSDGFIVGDASDDLYFQALSNGEVVIHDNPTLMPGAINTTFSITSSSGTTNLGSAYCVFGGDVDINGDLDVTGRKDRIVSTAHYGRRRLTAYETAEPTFGDIGEGVIGADGKCYVDIDSIFAETICDSQYQVFVQPYGDSHLYIYERTPDHFVVAGAAGTAFGWELKARQKDFQNDRIDEYGLDKCLGASLNDDLDYISLLEEQLYGGL